MDITTRFYDIEITGTDRAGNVGTTTCSIIVVPHMPATVTGKGKGNNNQQRKLKGVLKMNPKKNKSKSGGKSGGIIKEPQPHDPNALRQQFKLSTQRFEISTVSFVWDSELNTTLADPPLPTVERVHGSFPGCVQNQYKKDEALSPPPPTPLLSRSPPRMIPWMANEDGIVGPNPKIEVDRLCYDTVGENLVVTYNLFLEKQQDLSSVTTDITIQVYDMNNIEIVFENIILNPRVKNNPLLSSLSCGIETCHTWTSRGGLQMSTTNLIGNGHDYGVLLLAKTTTTDDDANNINDNSRLEILAGVSFRLGGCNE